MNIISYHKIVETNKDTLSKFSKHGRVLAINFAMNQFNKRNNKQNKVYVPII